MLLFIKQCYNGIALVEELTVRAWKNCFLVVTILLDKMQIPNFAAIFNGIRGFCESVEQFSMLMKGEFGQA